ncbi:MAG: hypothetical protein WCA83_04665 [Azonexus sp.]
MTISSLPAAIAFSLILAACGIVPQPSPSPHNGQLEFHLSSGSYHCAQGVRVLVEREIRDRVTYRINIGWNGNSYRLERDPSYSGLPRFEDNFSGLVWIDLPWKGLLLDGKSNKPLANECRPV